jgi:hypothetical protein
MSNVIIYYVKIPKVDCGLPTQSFKRRRCGAGFSYRDIHFTLIVRYFRANPEEADFWKVFRGDYYERIFGASVNEVNVHFSVFMGFSGTLSMT